MKKRGVAAKLDDITCRAAKSWDGTATGCHNPILYSPGLDASGKPLRMYPPDARR